MKKILFLTGTRADFGKIKPLISAVGDSDSFESYIFATGMHALLRYGLTVNEIYKSGYDNRGYNNIHVYLNQQHGDPMDRVLANTVTGLSMYVGEYKPDLIVVHGDRVEALAGAIVGSLNNIKVAHIEGGELSGTIDGVLRHAISKLAHIHFVANEEACRRLKQLGEDNIYIIGSPDVDVMLSDLPELNEVKRYYEIGYLNYAIAMYHSVTTDPCDQRAGMFADALMLSGKNYIVIYPNNDPGSESIIAAYGRLERSARFKVFPSLRFEYFLTLLKHADFIIGNSSAGIREAPIYGVYSLNIGDRQQQRYTCDSIINVGDNTSAIVHGIRQLDTMPECKPDFGFGRGDSAKKFMEVLEGDIWSISVQKKFNDIKGVGVGV